MGAPQASHRDHRGKVGHVDSLGRNALAEMPHRVRRRIAVRPADAPALAVVVAWRVVLALAEVEPPRIHSGPPEHAPAHASVVGPVHADALAPGLGREDGQRLALEALEALHAGGNHRRVARVKAREVRPQGEERAEAGGHNLAIHSSPQTEQCARSTSPHAPHSGGGFGNASDAGRRRPSTRCERSTSDSDA